MFEIQVLVPLADNDGTLFSEDVHVLFERFVLERFGGLTRLPSEAEGKWVEGDVLYRDRLRVYAIAVAGLTQGAQVAEIVAYVKTHYRQLAVYVRYLGLSEVL